MGDGPPCFQRDFTCPAVLRIHFRDNEISITGLLPSLACLSRLLHLFHCFVTPYKVSYNPEKHAFRFGLFPVSLAATQGIGYDSITNRGFPHSDISGSLLTYSSPKRFGVCPVLLRLLVPRHPPYALTNLIVCFLSLVMYKLNITIKCFSI